MTATIAPESGPLSRDGFARLLYAEWTKFRTVRGWVIAMVVAALLIAGFGIWASSGGQACGTMMPGGQIVAQRCPGPPLGPGGEAVTDSFYFVRQPLRGDGSLTVRVTALAGGTPSANPDGPFTAGLQPWAKAGIIVAASLRPGSAYAAMLVTGGHGVRMQDDYTGDLAGPGGAVPAASPRWLRLVRSGDMLNGYESADGTHWIRVGTARLAGLPSVVPAGLFVTSPDSVTAESSSPTLATAVFDHVVMPAAGPRGAWRGGPVGPVGAAAAPGGRFRLADGQFTVSGAGDIAPAVANSSWSAKPADHSLTGAFAGLIVVIVVGTMFMTAEYRRGLIRTTLAASPDRPRVLAAKAIVIGSAAFVAGLAAAAGAVLIGTDIANSNGTPLFPEPWPTELRIIAGTAALIAVAAILTLAIATIVRRSATAILIVIVVIVIPFVLSAPPGIPTGLTDWLLRVTPAAAFALQQPAPQYYQVQANYIPSSGYFPLAPWTGFAVLCGWTLLALVLAAYLLRRRDA